MKIAIIDDERLARTELKRLLVRHPEASVAGEAATISEAEQLIAETRPDLIFLDIQMPDGSGFDLLAKLDHTPKVIFTTAYDQYALKAFEVSALDYLLKPVAPARLQQALAKYFAQFQADHEKGKKLFIKDGDRCWFVALESIVLFESEGNYTRVYFEQNKPLILRSLTQIEQGLDPTQFVRSSRQHIVNMAFVSSIRQQSAGGITLILNNDMRIEMSRRRARECKLQYGTWQLTPEKA
jgi:two-component system LytT family response regulator